MADFAASLAQARTLLFVPGDRPERFDKAVRSGADAVIVDLEDAVAAADKAKARQAVHDGWDTLRQAGVPVVLRVNAQGTPSWDDDVALCATLAGPGAVMVPKVESPAPLLRLRSACPDAALIPMIETAASLRAIDAVAGAPSVVRLALGTFDFLADTGILPGDDEAEIAPLRFALAVATRNAGLAPAIDGVTLEIHDAARVREATLRAPLRLRRQAVHPSAAGARRAPGAGAVRRGGRLGEARGRRGSGRAGRGGAGRRPDGRRARSAAGAARAREGGARGVAGRRGAARKSVAPHRRPVGLRQLPAGHPAFVGCATPGYNL